MKYRLTILIVALGLLIVPVTTMAGKLPVYRISVSEYPSWSAFFVAHAARLIHQDAGKVGPLEEKWGVDMQIMWDSYDGTIGKYGARECEAACLTNLDILILSPQRAAVAILPTSTSYGADAICVPKSIKALTDLKGKPVNGLDVSVAEYNYVRNLEEAGLDLKEYPFASMDPDAVAAAIQQGKNLYGALWEPMRSETLAKRPDYHVVADSKAIEGEIVDMVVMGQDVFQKPEGARFAGLIVEVYYELNKLLDSPDASTSDRAHRAVGAKFGSFTAEQIKDIRTRCKFYGTRADGLKILSEQHMAPVMIHQQGFIKVRGATDRTPTVAYGTADEVGRCDLRFDPTWVKGYDK